MGPFLSWLQYTSIIYTIGKTRYLYDALPVLHYFSVFVMVGTTALAATQLLDATDAGVTCGDFPSGRPAGRPDVATHGAQQLLSRKPLK